MSKKTVAEIEAELAEAKASEVEAAEAEKQAAAEAAEKDRQREALAHEIAEAEQKVAYFEQRTVAAQSHVVELTKRLHALG